MTNLSTPILYSQTYIHQSSFSFSLCHILQRLQLLGHWVSRNVVDGIGNAENLVRFLIGDFHRKLVFNGHYDFNSIQTIETQFIGKFCFRCHLGSIDLIKILDDIQDTVGDFLDVKKSLGKIMSRGKTQVAVNEEQ